jgi:colanic acid biosynthesis glycosyl transferase WcaI
LLTQWFDPEPTFKGLLFARELVNLGFEVEVLTGFPNYPGGKVYPGYRIRPIQREKIGEVAVTRVPLYPSHSESVIGRLANYLSFSLCAALYGVLVSKRPDVIYSYHPPLTTGFTAVAIRLARGVPVVCDIQDLWPDTLRATGMTRNQRVLGMIGCACDWFYRRMERLTVLSPGFKRMLVSRGVPESKIEVIYNWADEAALADSARQSSVPLPPGDFRVLFAGNLGRAQGLDAVLRAARLLLDRGSCAQLVFLGSGVEVEELKALKAQLGVSNVHFLAAVPMTEVGAYLAAADALLVHLRPDELFRITIPSKTQAYMAAGKPIVMGVDGDAADLVVRSGGGIVVQSGSEESIADGIVRMEAMSAENRASMGARAKSFYEAELSVRAGTLRFATIFSELAAHRSGAHAPAEGATR